MTHFLDVRYQGVPRLIGCGVLETKAGVLLVDPGPDASLAGLTRGLAAQGVGLGDVHAVLLTHIHLDHAGGVGTLVDAHPHVRVYVHRKGAHHLVHPDRLLASVRRLYGDRMETLWGAFRAVPENSVHALDGGETLDVGGRRLRVAYTPGHAIHHVSYLDERTGAAFVGDTAGFRIQGVPYLVPVAPPPDIQVEAWLESLAAIRRWEPERLVLTHFGPATDVAWHLGEMERKLVDWSEAVRRSLDGGGADADRAEAFHADRMAELPADLPEDVRVAYTRMGQPRSAWYGLARYWRKRPTRGTAAP